MENHPPENSKLQDLLSFTKDTSPADAKGPRPASKDAAQLLTLLKGDSTEPSGHLATANVSSPLPMRRHSFSSNPDLFENESRSPDPRYLGLQYSSNIEARNFSPSTGTKRQQVKNACTNCQRACKKCDDQRPCSRCTKYHLESSCTNSARKERKKGIKRGPYKRKYDEGDPLANRSIASTASPRDALHSFRTRVNDAPLHGHQPPLLPNLSRQATAEPPRYQYQPQSRFSPIIGMPRYTPSHGNSGDLRSSLIHKGPYSHLAEPKPSQYRPSTTSPISSGSGALPSLSELRYAEASSIHSPLPSSPYGWHARSHTATPASLPPPLPAPFPFAVPPSLYDGSLKGNWHDAGVAPLNFFPTHLSSPSACSPFSAQGLPYDSSLRRAWPTAPPDSRAGAPYAHSTGSSFGSNVSFTPLGPVYSAPHGLAGYQMLPTEEEDSRRHGRNAPPTYSGSPAAHPGSTAPHVFSRRNSLLKLPPLVGNADDRPVWAQARMKGHSSEQDALLHRPLAAHESPAKVLSIESYLKTTGSSRLASLLSDDSGALDQPAASSRALDELSEICSVEIDSSDVAKISNRKARAA